MTDADRHLVGHATDIEGFAPVQSESATFTLHGWQPVAPAGRNVYLNALAATGMPLTSCRLSDVKTTGSVRVTGFVERLDHNATDIWHAWCEPGPVARYKWAGLPSDRRKAWLKTVFKAWAVPDEDRDGGHYEIDGARISDITDFYCAIGEAINGPGCYFGWNLDALTDCLRGRFGVAPPFTLTWHASAESRKRIARFDTIMEIFAEADVQVDLR